MTFPYRIDFDHIEWETPIAGVRNGRMVGSDQVKQMN
jgi:hypothetical protein